MAKVALRRSRFGRQAEWVKIAVQLGPDTAAADDVERRWWHGDLLRRSGRARGRRAVTSCPLRARAAHARSWSSEKSSSKHSNSEKPTHEELAAVVTGRLACAVAAPPTAPPESGWIGWSCCKIRLLRCNGGAHWCRGKTWTPPRNPRRAGAAGAEFRAAQDRRRGAVGRSLGLLTDCDLNEPVRRVDASPRDKRCNPWKSAPRVTV